MAFVSGQGSAAASLRKQQAGSVCRAPAHAQWIMAASGSGSGASIPSDGNGNPNPNQNQFMESLRSQLEKNFALAPVEVKETECLYCAGSGKCACSWCKGKGTRMETELKSNEALQEDIERMMKGENVSMPGEVPVVCSACKGTCALPCRFCRGRGRGLYGFSSAQTP
ncbi:hypothetical protein FVE85_2853 [Porphyridium purpureum]|uniref:Uncharacterized protein n=1 Tax=Porphyridium purpureum TaxID=35688 RepID=A0A5J4YUV2_PORPP|nr:hypothetical protein FVE85_2853 [Porphyridium purpureum]|eukprot:POR9234..scf227_4